MKLRILSIGRTLQHECIEVGSFEHSNVLTDYEAIIVDPGGVCKLWEEVIPREDGLLFTDTSMYNGLGGRVKATLDRRSEEFARFLHAGGLAIVFLRPVGQPLLLRWSLPSQSVRDSNHNVYSFIFF